MTTTTPRHPALIGRTDHPIARRKRRAFVPGVATGYGWVLVMVVTVLNMCGLIMVLSASTPIAVRDGGWGTDYLKNQAVFTAIGLVGMAAAMLVSLDTWRRLAPLALGVSVLGLMAVLVPGVGVNVNGASRWIDLGLLQLQPSEFTKIGLLLFVARLLARRGEHVSDWRWSLLPVAVYLGGIGVLIMLQPNLGTMIVITVMVFAMLWAAGVPVRPLAFLGMLAAAAATAFVFLTDFRSSRFTSFLDPWADASGDGLQSIQAGIGFANGGLLGQGLGQSTAKAGFLPFAHTDYIYAVIGEELGLVGAVVVVLLFAAFAALGLWVAAHAGGTLTGADGPPDGPVDVRSRFAMLVAVGVTAWITVQAMMNLLVVVGSMPVTGVPLPFISYGGSALIASLTAVGLLLNVARHPADLHQRRVVAAER